VASPGAPFGQAGQEPLKKNVIVQPVKNKLSPKAMSDGYLQEVKRIVLKQISIRQGGFKRKS